MYFHAAIPPVFESITADLVVMNGSPATQSKLTSNLTPKPPERNFNSTQSELAVHLAIEPSTKHIACSVGKDGSVN